MNLELVELIITKVTDKFSEAMDRMMREMTNLLSNVITSKFAAIEDRLTAMEVKLATGPVAAVPPGRPRPQPLCC